MSSIVKFLRLQSEWFLQYFGLSYWTKTGRGHRLDMVTYHTLIFKILNKKNVEGQKDGGGVHFVLVFFGGGGLEGHFFGGGIIFLFSPPPPPQKKCGLQEKTIRPPPKKKICPPPPKHLLLYCNCITEDSIKRNLWFIQEANVTLYEVNNFLSINLVLKVLDFEEK